MQNGDQVAEFRSKLIASGGFEEVSVEEQTPTPDRQKVNVRFTATTKPAAELATLPIGPTAEEIEKAKSAPAVAPGGMGPPMGFPGGMPPGVMPTGFPVGAMPAGLPPGAVQSIKSLTVPANDFMRTLNDREKRTVRFAVIGIAAYLLVFYGYQGWDYLHAQRVEYLALLHEVQNLKSEIAPYESKAIHVEKLMKDSHLDPAQLSRDTVVAGASAALQKAAAANGIQVGPIRESPARTSAKEMASVQFEGTGQLHSVLALLHGIKSVGYPLLIDSLQMSRRFPSSRPGQVKLTSDRGYSRFRSVEAQREVPHAPETTRKLLQAACFVFVALFVFQITWLVLQLRPLSRVTIPALPSLPREKQSRTACSKRIQPLAAAGGAETQQQQPVPRNEPGYSRSGQCSFAGIQPAG